MISKLKAAVAGLALMASPALAVDLEFYFPVAVGGAAANTIEELTNEYIAANPGVNIDAIYAGSYQDTVAKALTAARGGNAPQLSVILSVDMYTLYDEDLIHAFDDFRHHRRRQSLAQVVLPGVHGKLHDRRQRPTASRSSARRRFCTTTKKPSRPRSQA